MSQTLILPASVILVAGVCALFFATPHHLRGRDDESAEAARSGHDAGRAGGRAERGCAERGSSVSG